MSTKYIKKKSIRKRRAKKRIVKRPLRLHVDIRGRFVIRNGRKSYIKSKKSNKQIAKNLIRSKDKYLESSGFNGETNPNFAKLKQINDDRFKLLTLENKKDDLTEVKKKLDNLLMPPTSLPALPAPPPPIGLLPGPESFPIFNDPASSFINVDSSIQKGNKGLARHIKGLNEIISIQGNRIGAEISNNYNLHSKAIQNLHNNFDELSKTIIDNEKKKIDDEKLKKIEKENKKYRKKLEKEEQESKQAVTNITSRLRDKYKVEEQYQAELKKVTEKNKKKNEETISKLNSEHEENIRKALEESQKQVAELTKKIEDTETKRLIDKSNFDNEMERSKKRAENIKLEEDKQMNENLVNIDNFVSNIVEDNDFFDRKEKTGKKIKKRTISDEFQDIGIKPATKKDKQYYQDRDKQKFTKSTKSTKSTKPIIIIAPEEEEYNLPEEEEDNLEEISMSDLENEDEDEDEDNIIKSINSRANEIMQKDARIGEKKAYNMAKDELASTAAETFKEVDRRKTAKSSKREAKEILKDYGAGHEINSGLSNIDINKIMRPYAKYGWSGCVASNEIKRLKIRPIMSFIANTEPDSQPGLHWVAVFIDTIHNKCVEFYDSFAGVPPTQIIEGIQYIIRKIRPSVYLKFKTNEIIDQRSNSTTCGWFAIMFLFNRYNGVSFMDATHFKDITQAEQEARKLAHSFGYI